MKKIYLIAVMMLAVITASAQQTLNLSTYAGTNVDKYDGQECKVIVNRQMFTGWNTISLPFAVTENELNEVFGSDCRLERLVGVEKNGNSLVLNFQDCKTGGIQPNVPYILHYTGANGSKKITKIATVEAGPASVSFAVNGTGETVTMACAQKQTDGIGYYGVLARDNHEATFVKVDETLSGFYATRCYVKLSSGNSTLLTTNHLAAGEISGIDAVAASSEKVDVFNISGQKVASRISVAEVNKLQPGVYVVKGQKIVVK